MNDDQLMNMTPDQILVYLRERSGNRPEEVPEGWHTIYNLAKAWNVSDQHTGQILHQAVRDGLMEKKQFRISTGGGVVRPVMHYRMIQK